MSQANLNEKHRSVLLGMLILGATNAEQSAYQNVEGGKTAWDELVAQGLIVKEGFFVLSPAGRDVVSSLLKKKKEAK